MQQSASRFYILNSVFQNIDHRLIQIQISQSSCFIQTAEFFAVGFDVVCNENDFFQQGHIWSACCMETDRIQHIFIHYLIFSLRYLCTKERMDQVCLFIHDFICFYFIFLAETQTHTFRIILRTVMQQTGNSRLLLILGCTVDLRQFHRFFRYAHCVDITFYGNCRLQFFLHCRNRQHKFHLFCCIVLIQTEFMDIVFHFLRKQVFDRFAFLFSFTNIRRRNCQRRHFHEMDAACIFFSDLTDIFEQSCFIIAGTCYRYEVAECQQSFRLFPAHDLIDGIGTSDKIQTYIRSADLFQFFNGVDGICGTGTIDFNTGYFEIFISHGRQYCHQVTVLVMCYFFIQFMGRSACGDKHHAVNFKSVAYRFRSYQMSIMDRVEGAAHNGDTLTILKICNFISHVSIPSFPSSIPDRLANSSAVFLAASNNILNPLLMIFVPSSSA